MSDNRTIREGDCFSFQPEFNGAVITFQGEDATVKVYKKIQGKDVLIGEGVTVGCSSSVINVQVQAGENIAICVDSAVGCVVIDVYSADITCSNCSDGEGGSSSCELNVTTLFETSTTILGDPLDYGILARQEGSDIFVSKVDHATKVETILAGSEISNATVGTTLSSGGYDGVWWSEDDQKFYVYLDQFKRDSTDPLIVFEHQRYIYEYDPVTDVFQLSVNLTNALFSQFNIDYGIGGSLSDYSITDPIAPVGVGEITQVDSLLYIFESNNFGGTIGEIYTVDVNTLVKTTVLSDYSTIINNDDSLSLNVRFVIGLWHLNNQLLISYIDNNDGLEKYAIVDDLTFASATPTGFFNGTQQSITANSLGFPISETEIYFFQGTLDPEGSTGTFIYDITTGDFTQDLNSPLYIGQDGNDRYAVEIIKEGVLVYQNICGGEVKYYDQFGAELDLTDEQIQGLKLPSNGSCTYEVITGGV